MIDWLAQGLIDLMINWLIGCRGWKVHYLVQRNEAEVCREGREDGQEVLGQADGQGQGQGQGQQGQVPAWRGE